MGFRVGAAGGVDQVPHRPRLADRPGRRRRACASCSRTWSPTATTPVAAPAPGNCQSSGHPFVPTGPDGEAVADSYQYLAAAAHRRRHPHRSGHLAHRRDLDQSGQRGPVAPASRPGLASMGEGRHPAHAEHHGRARPTRRSWPPAATASASSTTTPTTSAGLPGTVTSASPRWLRLTRTGDTITGYDSTNGTTLDTRSAPPTSPGLPATVDVGLFVTSPVAYQGSSDGVPTQATATFDHITLNGHTDAHGWQASSIGTPNDFYPTLGSRQRPALWRSVVLSGSGDIAPAVNLAVLGGNTASEHAAVRDRRRADRADRRRDHVRHRRVPPRSDPHHLHRDPPAGRGPRGQGARHRRRRLRGRRHRRRGRYPARASTSSTATATTSSPPALSPRRASSPGPAPCSRSPRSSSLALGTILRTQRRSHHRRHRRVHPAHPSSGRAFSAGTSGGGGADWLYRFTPAAGLVGARSPPPILARSATPTRWPTATTRSPRGPGSPCSASTPPLALTAAAFLLRRRDA